MIYEVSESKRYPGDEWHVEAINYDGDGEIYVAIFSGPDAQRLAEEYAAWKQSKTNG